MTVTFKEQDAPTVKWQGATDLKTSVNINMFSIEMLLKI